DAVVYGPPLNTHCTALEGPATVRISTPAPALSANRAGAVSIARHIVRKQKPSSRLAPTVCVGTRCTARSCIALRSRTPPWQQRIDHGPKITTGLAHVTRCFSGSEPVSFQLLRTLMKNACGPYLSAGRLPCRQWRATSVDVLHEAPFDPFRSFLRATFASHVSEGT